MATLPYRISGAFERKPTVSSSARLQNRVTSKNVWPYTVGISHFAQRAALPSPQSANNRSHRHDLYVVRASGSGFDDPTAFP